MPGKAASSLLPQPLLRTLPCGGQPFLPHFHSAPQSNPACPQMLLASTLALHLPGTHLSPSLHLALTPLSRTDAKMSLVRSHPPPKPSHLGQSEHPWCFPHRGIHHTLLTSKPQPAPTLHPALFPLPRMFFPQRIPSLPKGGSSDPSALIYFLRCPCRVSTGVCSHACI